MNEYFKSIPKHILTACKSLGRHFSMTMSSASAVAVTLTLMALFFLVAGNINNFTKHVESDLKIHATIDNLKSDDEIKIMKNNIKKLEVVKKVTFSSKEDELNILIDENGAVFEKYKNNNPINNVFIVEVKNATDIAATTVKLNKMDGILKAQYGGEGIEDMIDIFKSLRIGGAIFLLALAFIAVFLISNTIKMTIYTRHTEISIMRNVGATNWYIKTPFMMEGMCIGMLGAMIPILITSIGYTLLYHYMGGFFLSSMFVMLKPLPFASMICLSLLIAGAIVGVVGSFHAVNKYLRWSR